MDRKDSLNSYKDLEVIINGRNRTIKECAQAYNIDLEMLIAEYIETEDIDKSIINVTTKDKYLECFSAYIKASPTELLQEKFSSFKTNLSRLGKQYNDVLRFIYRSSDNMLSLSKMDIASILVYGNLHNEITRPLIEHKDSDYINSLIDFCLQPGKEGSLQMNRKDARKFVKIMSKYRISSKAFGYILNNTELFAYPSLDDGSEKDSSRPYIYSHEYEVKHLKVTLKNILSSDDITFRLSKKDIAVLLMHSYYRKPLIDYKSSRFVEFLTNYCANPQSKEPLELDRCDVDKMLDILLKNRISNDDFDSLKNVFDMWEYDFAIDEDL